MHHLAILALVTSTLAVTGDGEKSSNKSQTEWWSAQPIQCRSVPELQSPWIRTPADSFILSQLNEKGLRPSPDADARTLIRRLTYDLHGLPPTPQEIETFINDPRPDAYERLVDRLLESPRYGERWARHWLDIVHYGESHGYDKDKPRPNAWPYRDYVIQSLNADKPFGRFAEEQLAGDVLYPDDPDATVATGFIAAGPWDFVGHVELPETKTDGLIARYNDRDDMVSASMSTFVSLTVHCARCHDHKFDPMTQLDYYRLQAVFAGVDRSDRPFDRDPVTHAKRRALAAARAGFERELQLLEEPIARITSPEIQDIDRRLAEVKEALAKVPPAAKPTSPSNGYHSAIMLRAEHEKWVQVDLGSDMPVDEIRIVPARPTDFPDSPGFGFPLRYRLELSNDPNFRAATAVIDRTAADQPNPGDQPITVMASGQSARYVRLTATRLWKRTNDFVFALSELEVVSGGKNVARRSIATAFDSIESGRWSMKYLVDGYSSRFPIDPSGDSSSLVKRQRLESEAAALTAARQQQVDQHIDLDVKRRMSAVRASLEEVKSDLAQLPAPGLVYAATRDFARQGNFSPAVPPRPVHLLNRGDVKQPGPLVNPGSIASVNPLVADFELADPNDEGARRAALAHWITDPRNPLTWRSIVNRVWQYHFGRAIVDTPNDFGRMGGQPTHPELLDWLATWFLDNGQSMKALHKLIVTSSVYRQSSGYSDGTVAKERAVDGDNRYLWRMNRARLDAESIRDAALYVAGRLDCTMGGPSVQQFFFKDDHSPVYDYTQFDWDSPSARRRSIYRFIVRSVPDPFMDSFDCPDASQLTPRRNTTLTALQALSLLNNPFMISQAEHLAKRVRADAGETAAQVDVVCLLTLGRRPTADESRELVNYADSHGLENVCRLLLNSNEFMFVD